MSVARSKRILIVDDDPDTVTYLGAFLEDHGYEVATAGDGRQGMRAILDARPDLVLMDLMMPNQNGMQLYRDIRHSEALARLPVIVITGMADFQLFGHACVLLPDPAARIDKPPDLEALLHAVEQALS